MGTSGASVGARSSLVLGEDQLAMINLAYYTTPLDMDWDEPLARACKTRF